jgi:type I restriction enzyme M protein
VEIKDVDKTTYDLSVKNPSKGGEAVLRDAKDILEEIRSLDRESAEVMENIRKLLSA